MALVVLCALTWSAQAQLVTTEPAILQQGSQGIVLTYHADSPLGNLDLMGIQSNLDVYAHIGVITRKSTGMSDWKYTVTPWPTQQNAQTANTDKNRCVRIAPDTYTLTIGDLKTYFGIPAGEYVTHIAVLFRNADGTRVGRTADGGDIFLPVMSNGFQCALSSDLADEFFYEPTTVKFTFLTTAEADLHIFVNDVEIASAPASMKLEKSYTFNAIGDYTVRGTATYQGNTYNKTMTVAWPDESMKADYPGGVPKMGAVRNADGSVTFCLGAPGKRSVVLVPSWDDYQALDKNEMFYQDYEGNRYFWITVPDLPEKEWLPYYFEVDGKTKVGDPYAHLILDPYNDQSSQLNNVWPDRPKYPFDKVSGTYLGVYRSDMDDYQFSPFTIPDHDNLVIYELLLRDFTGTDGVARGNGSLKEAQARLPYLKQLGVNAIELMPIMEFAGNNSWGYKTNFYMAPDKAYGSPTDYKDFIEACHQNGMAVILDIVFNQSDGGHPWYQMYPISQNPMYNRIAPHDFSVLNDWNQGHPLVQQQWTDAIKYWMTAYNVDGFRFDLVKGLGDNNSYGNGTGAYNQSRIDRMKRLHAVIKSCKPDGIHINEDLAGADEEKALGADGQLQWANINDASCQFTMGYESNSNLFRFLSSRDGGRQWGSTVAYAESHDEERMAYKNAVWGVAGVKLPAGSDQTYTQKSIDRLGQLAVIMLMTPGPKMIWQFGELGNGQTTKKSDGNDTSPKVVCWSYLDDPVRMYLYDTYSACCNLRLNHPDLFSRNATFTPAGLYGPFTNQRSLDLVSGDKEVVVFINPKVNEEMTVTVKTTYLSASNNRLVRASQGFTPTLTNGTDHQVSVTVPANGFAIYATANVAGVTPDGIVTDSAAPVFRISGGSIVADGHSVEVYDLSGRRVANENLSRGIYIARAGQNAAKIAVR